MANAFVQVPPQSTGLKMQTFENLVGGNTVESEAVTLVRSSDNTEVGTNGQPLRVDPTGTTTQPVSGSVSVSNFPATQPVSGTLTVTQATGTNLHAVLDAGSAVIGHVIADSGSTTAVTGNVTVVQPTGTNLHVVVDTAPSTAVTGTVTANQGTANTLANAWPVELTDGTTGPAAVKAASTAAAATDKALVVAISPNNTVAVTQNTSPWVTSLTSTTITGTVAENITQVAGTNLGTPTNFGTTPGAVVAASVNSSLFIGTTAAVAGAAGVQKVGISGATAVTLDAADNATAPVNSILHAGLYSTTIPALTSGNSGAIRLDSTGAIYVNHEGRKTTYRAAVAAFAPIASATAPSISLTGSGTKTVRITKVGFSGTAATGGAADIVLQRLSVLSGGTSAAITIAKMDTNNATATAAPLSWSVAATTATSAGIIASVRYEIVTAAVTVQPEYVLWTFTDTASQAFVLRGTSDFAALRLSAIGTTPLFDIWIEWTEE